MGTYLDEYFVSEMWSMPYSCYPKSIELNEAEQAYEDAIEVALNEFLLYCLNEDGIFKRKRKTPTEPSSKK